MVAALLFQYGQNINADTVLLADHFESVLYIDKVIFRERTFADLQMEVREDCRRKGFGSFLIREIKKQCYLSGRVPAARTDLNNIASRAAPIKAGLALQVSCAREGSAKQNKLTAATFAL